MAENWLTYSELAEKLGCTTEAARAKARRMQWRRQLDNNGMARVLADLEALPPARTRPAGHREAERPNAQPVTTPDAETPPRIALEALEGHIATLKVQLDKAEAATAAERERVADLTAQLLRLTAQLINQRPRSWWRRQTG